MYVECNKQTIGSAYNNWIMNPILEIRLLENQGKLESDHHGYCVEATMGKMNWKYTAVFTYSIPLSENRGRNSIYNIYCKLILKENLPGMFQDGIK